MTSIRLFLLSVLIFSAMITKIKAGPVFVEKNQIPEIKNREDLVSLPDEELSKTEGSGAEDTMTKGIQTEPEEYRTDQSEAHDYYDDYYGEMEQELVQWSDMDPTFDVPTVNVTVTEGETAVLPCSVDNLGRFKIAWMDCISIPLSYEDRMMVDDERLSVVRSEVREWNLQISDVRREDEGEYRCTVGTSPVKSKSVMLRVKGQNQEHLDKDTDKENQVYLDQDKDAENEEDYSGETNKEDGLEQKKKVHVNHKQTTNLIAGVDPTFDVPTVNVTVTEGQTAVLPCSVDNLRTFKIAWLDRISIPLSYEDRRIVDDERFSVVRREVSEWNLQIRDVKREDEGEYRCAVNTRPVKSKSVMLRVNGKNQENLDIDTEKENQEYLDQDEDAENEEDYSGETNKKDELEVKKTINQKQTTTRIADDPKCNVTYTLSADKHTQGLDELGSADEYDEDSCREECMMNPHCYSCDYNTQDKTCFIGNKYKPHLRSFEGVNHYDICRVCPDKSKKRLILFARKEYQDI